MIKSIWEKIKLKFERKPAGDIMLSPGHWQMHDGCTLTEGSYKIDPPIDIFSYPTPSVVTPKPKRTKKTKTES